MFVLFTQRRLSLRQRNCMSAGYGGGPAALIMASYSKLHRCQGLACLPHNGSQPLPCATLPAAS